MKSIFTKLSTLLLCGAVAMVSCTDFSEDIQNLDNKVDNLGNTTQTELATLQKAITDLEAKLSAQYATKDEVAALKTTLENSIASEVAALSEDIAEVSAALNAAKNEINTAIAGLDEKKADKTAVEAAVKTATEAIAALQAELEAAKGDLEAEIASVKEQIAATQESLQEKINGVDAKANELQNTLLSLGDYLKTLEAKVNEINNTLLSLGEYLPTIEAKILEVKGTVESLGAEYEANKEVVDAKLTELFSTLVSLSNHLEEYEAATDFKLVELQGSLAALSTYLEEYEASVDAKFNEILNTFESLSLFLDEKFAALEATDTDLYKEIDGLREAFTTINNLLADEVAAREAEDGAIYELIGSSVTALNNLIADLEAEDEAIYAEMENVRTYVAQVYNSLSYEIAATNAALQAHIAAFEAFKEAYEAKVDELEATDENLYVEINGLREVITTINNHIDDLRAEDEAIYLEINGLRENLTQLQNAINNRIDEEVKDLKADILEKFNILNTVILETEKRVNDKFNHTLKLIAENSALIAANAAAIADLEAAVEMLMDWVTGQEETNAEHARLIAKVYEIVGEMEEQIAALTQKDNELEGLIGKTAGALQTYMDENNARLADLEMYIKENFNLLGTGIRNLEAIINDLEASFGARLDALEERMDAAEDKIADLEDQAAEMSEAIVNIEAAIAELQEMDAALAAEIANVDAAAKKALKEAREELQDQIDALVKAKEDLEARVKVLEELVAANEDAIEDNRAEIEANIKAISNAVSQLGKLEGTVNAMMQANASIHAALQQKDAALEESIKKAVEALAGAVSRITAVEQSIEAIYALAETLATKEQLDNATADLTAKIEREIATLQGQLVAYIAQNGANIAAIRTELQNVNALIESLTERMDKVEFDVEDLNNRLDALIEEYTEAIAALQGKDAELESTLKTLLNNFQGLKDEVAHHNDLIGLNQIDIAKLFKQVAELEAKLNEKVAELGDRINSVYNDLVAADNFFFEYFTKEIEGLEKAIEAVRALVVDAAQAAQQNDAQLEAKLKEHIAKIIAQIEANITSVIVDCAQNKADIANLKAAVEEAFKLLNEKVSNLANRVQSLVYVPEYDDHKARINFGIIYSDQDQIFDEVPVAKKSVLRYRVYAKAGESAEKAAADIAKAWTPETFYYEVEPVKRALTRSEATEATLEILEVENIGEYLYVTVMAKDFKTEFWSGGIEPKQALEDDPVIVVRPADEKNSYSVALVLSDGNNNRSTEYTNLVPALQNVFGAAVYDADDVNISGRSYIYAPDAYLPYDSDPDHVVVLQGHHLAFSDIFAEEFELLSVDDLIEMGYDIQLERTVDQTQLNTSEHQIHPISPIKPEVRKVGPFALEEKPFEGITKEGDTYVSLKQPMTKETYKALKENNQHIITIDYIYNINGVEVNTEASAELCNRLVEVEFNVDVPWTFETAMSTVSEGVAYAGKLSVKENAYDLNAAVKNNKSLAGYSLKTIIDAANEYGTKKAAGHYDIAVSEITADTYDIRIKNGSDKYQFPVNNNDDVVDYNTYSVTFSTEFDDLTVSVKFNMNLGEQAPVQKLSTAIDFTPANGANGWLFGKWNVLESAFKKFKKDGYILEESKDAFIATFADATYDTPLVNGKNGIKQNTNVAFEAGENTFQLWHEQIDDEYVNGTKHRIQQTATPIFGTQFDFYVNGTVKLGDYALDLDGVRVVDGKVNVKGEIANNVYTVDVSDLAMYYYVVNEVGTKSLEAVNEGDVLTVDFSLAPMKEVTEDGFNFNGTTDLTEYSLNVDWTGTLSDVPYILPLNKAVVNWGTYPHTEVEVNAVLKVNGFPVASKPITLVTTDPLEIALKDVTVEVTHLSGTNPKPVVAKVYQNFELYSAVEEGNLFNNNAKTIGGLWHFSKANQTYGVTMKLEYNRVYYKVGENEIGWDESKIVLDKYTTDNLVAPYKVGDLTGNLYIKQDDGDIETPIYVEFRVTMTHNIHDGAKTKCETSGLVTVKFVPEGYVEVAE